MSQQFGSPTSTGGSGGQDGLDGQDGKSAYELAVIDGFVGTQTEWLASLKGDAGTNGIDGQNGTQGLKGDDGNTIIDQRTQQAIKVWTGTQAQYDAVTPKDANTMYLVKP